MSKRKTRDVDQELRDIESGKLKISNTPKTVGVCVGWYIPEVDHAKICAALGVCEHEGCAKIAGHEGPHT